MRLRPTLRASHLAIFGVAATSLGIIVTHPAMTAYGGALLFGVALSRALTRVSVARARAAGFEMLWTTTDSVERVTRGHEVVITAELRNRDTLPTHFRNLDVSHSPALEITCSPRSGEVPPGGRLALRLHVRAHRVGYHGIHNITLQTIRAPGLYTVPLSFSNPFVVEVLPKAVRLGTTGAIGGRTQMIAPSARVGRRKGDGAELREIREHAPGDPYRRIAWKPSARRGKLLIIENEQEQSDVVWLVVDASVDAASGLIGQAALDFAIDEATSIMDAHLTRGDQVGLAVVGTRVLSKVLPGRGPRHAAKILAALSLETHTADADRSDWDDGDVARRVLEHAASIDGEAAQLKSYEHEKLALLAARLLRHAPVTAEAPWAHSSTGRTLRKYLLSFGIHPPPRGTSDRHHCEREIAKALRDITSTRRPPTLVYLFGRPPTFETPRQLLDVLARIPKHRTEVRFVPALESSELDDSAAKNKLRSESQSLMVQDALRHRQRIASEDGIQQLSRIGVRLARPRRFYPKKRPDDAA